MPRVGAILLLFLACRGEGGPRGSDLGPVDASHDEFPPDAGGPTGACAPTSIARSPHNGHATAGRDDALRPMFRWAPVRDATRYEIQVDDSCGADFRACAFPSPEVDESTPALSFSPATDLPVSTSAPVGRRYFWRVRSCDDTTCAAWSEPRYLDVGRSSNDTDGDGLADLVVGVRSKDAGAVNEGNVLVYRGSMAGLPSVPDDTLDNPQNQGGAGFGYAVATGDVNGDGFADVIAGAPSQDNGAANEGAVFAFLGSASGLPDVPDATLDNPDNEDLAFFGSALTTGDFNGDGFADVAVGVPSRRAGDGGVFVYLGSGTGLAETPAHTLEPAGAVAGTVFGAALASGGDFSGDGTVDLAAGAVGDDPKRPGGAVFVYCGGTGGLPAAPDESLYSPAADDSSAFGSAVAVGDVDGDGLADLAAAAPQAFGGGAVWVFHGRAIGISLAPSGTLTGPGGRFGGALAMGDLDGDARADVVVGADEYALGAIVGGAVFIYPGPNTDGTPPAPTGLGNPDGQANGHFGASLAVPGDVDGDGLLDLSVGAPDQPVAGRAFVYYGAGGIGQVPDLALDEPAGESGARFGYSLALRLPFAPDSTRLRPMTENLAPLLRGRF